MARESDTRMHPAVSIVAGLLAWLLPGAGHMYIRRWVRGIILFVTIQGLFWTGMAIGGVFTVNPREELWWSRAQLCAGLSGVLCYYRQDLNYKSHLLAVKQDGRSDADAPEFIRQRLAANELVLVAPAANPAYVFTGVAGMLNLLCIIDVVLLGAVGRRGELTLAEADQVEGVS